MNVTIIDLPQEVEIQQLLNLGLSAQILGDLRKHRSNIQQIVLEDMLHCTFPDEYFDGVVCIEVIEHVELDHLFVSQIHRVLKPGGWVYLSTPNGEYIRYDPSHNTDHKRLYRRSELANLLKINFDEVEVWYGIRTGKYRVRGFCSMSLKHPINTIITMLSNAVNNIQSYRAENKPRRTAHLFAIAKKIH